MLVPVILSGGSGSRLWPVSREASPKPFMRLGDGESLLRMTFDRARSLPGVSEVVTVTNHEHLFGTCDEYGASSVAGTIMLEPFGRNTAPALAMAAIEIRERHGDDAVLVMLAADHLIRDTAAFAADVAVAASLAREGMLVTFGIPPSRPETGFGYIELGDSLSPPNAFRARSFVEKPFRELAEKYVASGNYLWNSGMFCFPREHSSPRFASTSRRFSSSARDSGNRARSALTAARASWTSTRWASNNCPTSPSTSR
jgi:mannose-1-phosphate guanylyltransferase